MMKDQNNDPAIKVAELTVSYGRNSILDRLGLEVPPGGVYGLLGRNGTGKTTLVRHVLGHERPRHGSVEVLGSDVCRDRRELMKRVGFVPETPQAPQTATAEQLLAMGARLYARWDRGDAVARLKRFGVPLDTSFGSLSKGQQRQVELALALAQRPELLILDDPSLGLDAIAKKALYEELLEHLARQGVTVFLTSHDLDALERLVETVAILDRGRLLVEESLDGLKQRFRRLRWTESEGSIAASSVVSRRRGPWGAETVVTFDDELAFFAQVEELGAAVDVETMSLEHIFEALVGHQTRGDHS